MNPVRGLFLWASQSRTLREVLPRFRFVQRAVRRFMPGETIEDALDAAHVLKSNRIRTVLTFLGENTSERSEAEKVSEHYREVLEKIKARNLECHLSVKLTQLGLDLDEDLCYQNLTSIARRAAELDNFIWIDMESSAYVKRTIDLFKRVRTKYSNIGLCLQAYLFRTADDLKELLALSAVIRLVKGAYAEPKEIAFKRKKDVDENYFALSRVLLEAALKNGLRTAIATHDPRLIHRIQSEMVAAGTPAEACEFQMLYGIRRDQQLLLSREGFHTRVLISYGRFWFPWYMRRLAERPSNILFVLRNIFTG